jgi:hypothetical protein
MSEMRLSYLDMRAHSLYMPLENSLEALCITASALRSEGTKKPRWKPRFLFGGANQCAAQCEQDYSSASDSCSGSAASTESAASAATSRMDSLIRPR